MARETLSLENLGACALRGIQAEEAKFERAIREARQLYTKAAQTEQEALEGRGRHLAAIAHDLCITFPQGARVRVVGHHLEVLWEGGPDAVLSWDSGEEEAKEEDATIPSEALA